RTGTIIYGIAAVFSSVLLASVKPSFWLTAIVALLPVAMILFRRRWFWQKIAFVGGVATCAALLSLPRHSLVRNGEIGQCFLPTQLFVIHANLIRDQMADDLQRG